ncbi:MAG: class I SAM-dependent methyltransferase [Desulfobacteraceae bacterium]|nr:class I SAM-dependent methyltransferase [Desulfobacteraceae bacterium]
MNKPEKRNASSYCNYNDSFLSYDQNRQPNGLQEILHIFGQTRIPVEEQTVLEGGFGTGAYINHIRHSMKEVYGVEGSEQGYEETKQKVGDADNVHLQIGNILDLSFSDDFFDAYMVNQVLHHIDTDRSYPNLTLFLKESRRVIKPGGALTINTCSQEQLNPHSGVYWNYKYIEKAALTLQARYVPVPKLISRLEELGFTDIKTTMPSGKLFQEQYYHDPRLALDTDFQKADSIYCFCSEKQINEANTLIRSGIDDGSIYQHMEQAEKQAQKIGEAVIVSARKPL